ncbi:sensor histidine kinase [Paenibacillus methanolicus]|uniref:Sensor histidine kinase YesM n=1 Tax=Paenibacillus methanolicus TaxID=582686 RepID=A0A5S5C609_9BACL|nr:sensor histidine kinase [Paenibacillus methanolicus]TYP74865.1 sensor histidine kinase YesM [Paenibacillus methanolicus]
MQWLLKFSFYRRIQLSLIVFILLPLAFVSVASYYLIKDVVVEKVNASNQNMVNVMASDLDKNVEDMIYASNLFGASDSNTLEELIAFKDVRNLSSSKDYFTHRRIAEFMDLAYSKTSGLNAQVFFVNNSDFVIYAANNVLDYPSLNRWLRQRTEPAAGNRMRWEKAEGLLQISGKRTESYYFAVKSIRTPDNGSKLGTLYVGIPSEYFERTFAKGGDGAFRLLAADGGLIYGYAKGADLSGLAHAKEVQAKVGRPGWKLLFRYDSKSITAEISQVYKFYAITLSACVAAFLVISVFIARTLHRPLHKLRRTAEQFGGGNRMLRFPVRGKDEVAVLGTAFNHMLDQINRLIAEVEQEQEEKREIELHALFSQIRPHFLLNTLNSIKCNLVLEGDPVHSRQIDALMSLLRAYMRVNEPCTLRQECKLLQDYADIMQMRSDMPIALHVELDETVAELEVPRLMLQPLVENAIVHGFEDGREDAAIWLSARREGGDCVIAVSDNGRGMSETDLERLRRTLRDENEPQATDKRIGLANVWSRVKLTYGPASGMAIERSGRGGMAFTMTIPGKMPAGRGEAGYVQSDAG